MASKYQIDGIQIKAEILENAAKEAHLTPEQKAAIVEASLTVIDEVVGEDNFDVATKLSKQAIALVRLSKNRDLRYTILLKNKEVETMAKAYDDAKEAIATLDTKANDPEANLIVGKYECFTKSDWDKGLPMLAKGSNEELKALAEEDIADTETPTHKLHLVMSGGTLVPNRRMWLTSSRR